MVQEKNFSVMCSEVLEILKYCPKSDVNKISSKTIMLLNNNKDINHKVEIDPSKSIFEQQVIEETIVMIFIIFRNYWASLEEKEEIDKILNENEIKFNDFYAYNNIFNKDNKEEKNIINEFNNSKNNNMELIEYKESFVKKFINAIKDFFLK